MINGLMDIVSPFHHRLYPLYRDNLVMSKGNSYLYSARLLTQFVKYLSTRVMVNYTDPEDLFNMIYPIIQISI